MFSFCLFFGGGGGRAIFMPNLIIEYLNGFVECKGYDNKDGGCRNTPAQDVSPHREHVLPLAK